MCGERPIRLVDDENRGNVLEVNWNVSMHVGTMIVFDPPIFGHDGAWIVTGWPLIIGIHGHDAEYAAEQFTIRRHTPSGG